MKVAHVVPHLDDEASGPSLSVIRLCESLADIGQSVQLHAMAAARSPQGVELVLHREWPLLGRFGFSLELVRSLHAVSRSVDIVHNHSLWAFPNVVAGLATSGARAMLVTSPRGTLAEAALSHSRLKKFALRPLQWPVITRASCLHATGTNEYRDIRQLGLEQPVAVIPNGIDIPTLPDGNRISIPNRRRLLFLGRLHPIKGIELLLETWQALQDHHPTWELVIAGKGDANYVRSLHEAASELNLQRISFSGPVYGEDKQRVYMSAELFVLPTFTENFGGSVSNVMSLLRNLVDIMIDQKTEVWEKKIADRKKAERKLQNENVAA